MQTKAMTAEELLVMPDDRTQLYELVRGALISKPLYGMAHALMCSHLGRHLGNYVERQKLGVTVGPDTGFILERDPDTVRAPHAAFIRAERYFRTEVYLPGAPDLAVEHLTIDDTLDGGDVVPGWTLPLCELFAD